MASIITPMEMQELQSSDLQLVSSPYGYFQLQTKVDKRAVSLNGETPERMVSALHIRKMFRSLREAGVNISCSKVPLQVTIRRHVVPEIKDCGSGSASWN